MSRLYFGTIDETVEVKGWEKHWLGSLADKVALGLVDAQNHTERLTQLINPTHYMSRWNPDGQNRVGWSNMFGAAFRNEYPPSETVLTWQGHPIDGWGVLLNTAVAVGNDAVKLAARVNSQCELHAWIDGPDRAWVADMIEAAAASGVYRMSLRREPEFPERSALEWPEDEPSGWKQVIEMLRSDNTCPVVTSYSAADWFPNMRTAGWDVDRWREWEDLTDSDQWHHSMRGLQDGEYAREYTGLQIKPDDWNTFRFNHSLTVFDLYADDYAERLNKHFKIGEKVT